MVCDGILMTATSSTFRPHPGRVTEICSVSRKLLQHGIEALVYSNHPKETAESTYLAIIFGQIVSDVPWFFHLTTVLMQLQY